MDIAKDTSGGMDIFDNNDQVYYEFSRDNFDGKKVIKLEYEAYTPMAKKKLKELCNHLRVKWADLYHIAIYHRQSIYILGQYVIWL